MDTKLLTRLLDDAAFAEDIICFCKEFPEYRENRKQLDDWYKKLEKQMGLEESCKFEETVDRYYNRCAQAYYVFGLHLRDELKRAMMEG